MDKFAETIMFQRLSDPATILTQDELEAYCKYTLTLDEEIRGEFSILDKLLQTRIIISNSTYVKKFTTYCNKCLNYFGSEGNYLWTNFPTN